MPTPQSSNSNSSASDLVNSGCLMSMLPCFEKPSRDTSAQQCVCTGMIDQIAEWCFVSIGMDRKVFEHPLQERGIFGRWHDFRALPEFYDLRKQLIVQTEVYPHQILDSVRTQQPLVPGYIAQDFEVAIQSRIDKAGAPDASDSAIIAVSRWVRNGPTGLAALRVERQPSSSVSARTKTASLSKPASCPGAYRYHTNRHSS